MNLFEHPAYNINTRERKHSKHTSNERHNTRLAVLRTIFLVLALVVLVEHTDWWHSYADENHYIKNQIMSIRRFSYYDTSKN